MSIYPYIYLPVSTYMRVFICVFICISEGRTSVEDNSRLASALVVVTAWSEPGKVNRKLRGSGCLVRDKGRSFRPRLRAPVSIAQVCDSGQSATHIYAIQYRTELTRLMTLIGFSSYSSWAGGLSCYHELQTGSSIFLPRAYLLGACPTVN